MFARTETDFVYDEQQAISERLKALANQIYDLQDRLDELRGDHARMEHVDGVRAKLISEALARGVTELHALVWQKREEEKGFRRLRTETEGIFGVRTAGLVEAGGI